MPDVLDYSSGWPPPVAIRAGGYVGVVRYIGTRGRSKNLTTAEATAMKAAGIPIGLVYEEGAGWMRGGAAAGAAAAHAALADAAACGVTVRCVYLACDEDVTTQMSAVMACLDGAATILGKARTGVYGEADVIDAAVPGHAAWGWQTRAWSGGRVSSRAALLQQIGYVAVGGVECDRNTVLRDDWGQSPYQETDMTPEEHDTLMALYPLLARGEIDGKQEPSHHAYSMLGLRERLDAQDRTHAALTAQIAGLGGQLTAQASAIAALSGLIGAGTNDLTAEQVETAVRTAIAESLVHVQVSVDSTPPPAA